MEKDPFRSGHSLQYSTQIVEVGRIYAYDCALTNFGLGQYKWVCGQPLHLKYSLAFSA